jgi:hypothetical protein
MRRPKTTVSISILAILLIGGGLYFAFRGTMHRQQEEAISEAVFKQLLQMPDVQRYEQNNSLFISREDERFDTKFLARFGKSSNSIRLAEHGSIRWIDMAPFDARSGEPAMILHLGKICWISWRQVSVPATYSCGMLCAYGGMVHLHRTGWITWTVDSVSDQFISFLGSTSERAEKHPGAKNGSSKSCRWKFLN